MASAAGKNIFIVGAKRTPFGSFGGKLKGMSATALSAHCSKAAIAHAGVDPTFIEEVNIGNVIQTATDAAYLARHVGIMTGMPQEAHAMTINRLCGSGFETVIMGAEAIELGRSKIALAGGAENMSAAPMVIDGITARWSPPPLGKGLQATDALWNGLTDQLAKLPMGLTAEKLGAQYGITREQCDEFALRSQNLSQKSTEDGILANEIAPIELKGRKGAVDTLAHDEAVRFGAKIGDLTKLKSVFQENGLVTAGSASGITDGAASLVVAGDEAVAQHGLKPLSRVVSWARVGCDPSIMGVGPVPAIRNALAAAGLTLQDMDLVEINEAFAAQFLACEKELGLDREKCNLNGGAIALGHPLGASGSRILVNLTHELVRTGKKYAIGSACIGGGQGIAVVLENATL
jgi:acetyl-CoA acyltransferase 2